MKKYILAFSILVSGLLKLEAQSLQLLDTTTNAVAATSYTFTVDTAAGMSFGFTLKNLTSSAVTFKVKKEVISNASGFGISFCTGTNCYTPATNLSSAITIAANGTLPTPHSTPVTYGLTTDFNAAAFTGSPTGSAQVLYTLFNTANTSDSVSVVIYYNVSAAATGIKQFAANYSVSNIAPNPASTNVSLSYDLKNTSQPATLKIYNMLGAVVKTVSLETYNNNTKVDVSSLEEGMYFYSVLVGGKAIKTSRLIVSR
jgi:hypothetical protein